MDIQIVRDPGNPAGGYAQIVVRRAPGDVTETTVHVQRREDDAYLSMQGWSSQPDSLGPYGVQPLADGATLIVGPEVVNEIEPFQGLIVTVVALEVSSNLDWPDDIPKLQKRRRVGGVRTATRVTLTPEPMIGGDQGKKPELSEPKPERQPNPVPEPKPAPVPEPPDPAPEPEPTPTPAPPEPEPPKPGPEPKRSRLPMVVGLILLVAAIGGGAWFAATQLGGETPPMTENDDGLACSPTGVSDEDMDLRWEMAETCLGAGDLNSALVLVERLVSEGHGGASEQMGRWLDPEETGASPLTSKSPLSALRMYVGARDAGVAELGDRIKGICDGLDTVDDIAVEVAFNKYCAEE